MKLPDKKQIIIFAYGMAFLIVIGVMFFTDAWPAYVKFVINLLKKGGIMSLPISAGLILTFVAVYTPVYFASYLVGHSVRPHLVDGENIKKKLSELGSRLDETANYVRNLQSELSQLEQARDEIKDEIRVLEQIKEQNIERLGGKFDVKLRDRSRDKLFAQVQAFVYGVLASVVASYVYAYLTGA